MFVELRRLGILKDLIRVLKLRLSKKVGNHLKKKGKQLKNRATTPVSTDYSPEIDGSEELGEIKSAYYQSLNGILRWMDISHEVSMLSLHVALPRKGHLELVYYIILYLKIYHNARLVLDP